jgi:hypothetical protein
MFKKFVKKKKKKIILKKIYKIRSLKIIFVVFKKK